MSFEELQKLIHDSGIVGAGGAGFPSYAKLDRRADTIILNCAECEPLLRLHRHLLAHKVNEILHALDVIAKTVGVKNVIIATKAAYTQTVEAIEAALPSFENIHICKLKEVYPAGDEVILIYEATGRVVAPGALPISVGVNVFNTETVYNIYRALNGIPVTHKYITIAGEVKNPQTFLAPLGTPYSLLIEKAGGVTTEHPAYIMGGPMMGSLGSVNDVVKKTSNAVIVLPDDHYVVKRKQVNFKIDMKRAMAACCQCRYCTDLCPRHLLGHPIQPHEFMRVLSNHDFQNIEPYFDAMYCSGCGLCEMYSCGQGLSPRALIGVFKSEMRKQGYKVPAAEAAPVPEDRNLRRVPLERLRGRLDLEKYNKSAPITEEAILPETVKLMLSQHVGIPASPVVKLGDAVKAGQVVAQAAEGKLSVPVHCPIDGIVTEVTGQFMIVHRNGGNEA